MRSGKPNQTFWRACLNRVSVRRNLEEELSYAGTAESTLAFKMQELKDRFDRVFPTAQPARLYLHRTGRTLTLRWRLASDQRQKHDFFELRHDTSPGREILDSLSTTKRNRYLTFQANALDLNTAYAIHRYQRDRLRDHNDKIETLATTIRYYSARANDMDFDAVEQPDQSVSNFQSE